MRTVLGPVTQNRRPRLLADVKTYIDANLGDPGLSPRSRAERHYISVRALHKLFESEELTVSRWIRHRRLDRCRAELADPALAGEPVHAIAARWGLGSPSHFATRSASRTAARRRSTGGRAAPSARGRFLPRLAGGWEDEGFVRVVVWIVEGSWEATVDAARSVLPPGATVELLHVAGKAEALARAGRRGLLGGRHPHLLHGRDPVSTASEHEAQALLADAADRLGRDAERTARRGHPTEEVLAAAEEADLLVMARGGEPGHLGPKSIGHAQRFVLDHTGCAVLLVPG
jgi:AraC-like DNA-binding protein/nucleotide-binding universal stress UspA family protein